MSDIRYLLGIFVLGDQLDFSGIIDELILIWSASTAEEYRDQLRYLPVSR